MGKSAESDEAHSDAHCKPLESTEAPPLESFDSDALTFEEEELVRSLSPLTPPSEQAEDLADLEPNKFEIAASTKSHQNSRPSKSLEHFSRTRPSQKQLNARVSCKSDWLML